MEFIISFIFTFLIGYWLLTHRYKVVDKSWDGRNYEYKKKYGKVDAKVWHLVVLLLISSIPVVGFLIVAFFAFYWCIGENRFYIFDPNNKKKPSFLDKSVKRIVDFFNKPIK